MLNKTIIVFIYVFVLNIFLLKSQSQIINLCEATPVNKKYWVESVSGYNSVWSIDPYVEFDDSQNDIIEVQWKNPGTYTVIAQYFNENCSNKNEIQVQVEECPEFYIYVPNSFTPNADGTNDVFEIFGKGIIEFNMVVFDRWGTEIFSSNKIEKYSDGLRMGGWDGTFKSIPCQGEVYAYAIKYKGINSAKKAIYGKILLIK
jgi:gliding motility-associated-like protein